MSNVRDTVAGWGGIRVLRQEQRTALGASVQELQAGGVNWAPESERVLGEGDVVALPPGPGIGRYQVRKRKRHGRRPAAPAAVAMS